MSSGNSDPMRVRVRHVHSAIHGLQCSARRLACAQRPRMNQKIGLAVAFGTIVEVKRRQWRRARGRSRPRPEPERLGHIAAIQMPETRRHRLPVSRLSGRGPLKALRKLPTMKLKLCKGTAVSENVSSRTRVWDAYLVGHSRRRQAVRLLERDRGTRDAGHNRPVLCRVKTVALTQ